MPGGRKSCPGGGAVLRRSVRAAGCGPRFLESAARGKGTGLAASDLGPGAESVGQVGKTTIEPAFREACETGRYRGPRGRGGGGRPGPCRPGGAWATGVALGVPPAEWFAGQNWGHNAGLRVWRRLLAEKPPPEGEDWVLASIAETAVGALDWSAPFGPSDPWEFSRWAADIVTAAERQQHPFLDAAGQPMPWRACLAVSRNPAQPFLFGTIPEGAAGRKVDGASGWPLSARSWNATAARGNAPGTNDMITCSGSRTSPPCYPTTPTTHRSTRRP